MRYRKRPLGVEAFQFGLDHRPDWFVKALVQGHVLLHRDTQRGTLLTPDGVKHFYERDFITFDGTDMKVYAEEQFTRLFEPSE